MATLVLTTVGGIIGGPIGAMLGGVLGQSVDGALFKPKGREGPRLNELKVQTSSYGTPIPKLFGTLRVAGSVIWATDLREHRHRESGKGRPTVTTYSYTASFAVALSARPIVSVGRIWADGKLLRGAAGDWKARTGFRLHTGREDQAPDPLIASAEGLTLSPAHRGIAYAVFEDLELADFGQRIPSLTFEVVADAGPVEAGAIVEALTHGRVGAGGAAQPIGGFSAYGGSQRAVIEPVVQAAGAWPDLSGGTMRLAVGEEIPVAVEDSGVGAGAGAARSRAIAASDQAPRKVTLSHYDPARDYQAGLQQAVRPGAGHRVEAIELPAALSAGQAKQLAELALARADIERERRTVTTDWSALRIAPGAAVRVAGEPGDWRVAACGVEQMAVSLELVRIAPAALPAIAAGGRVLGANDVLAGETLLHAVELSHLGEGLPNAPRISIAACGTAPGWRRAALSISTDGGARWEPVGGTALPAILGVVEAPAGAADPAIEDRRSAMIVELAHNDMQLADADRPALEAGRNLALAGGELLQFGRAEPLGGARWRLTQLWRGRRGTEAAVGAGAPGDGFLLIEAETLLQHDLSSAGSGEVRVMAIGSGDVAGVETLAERTGASLLPPSPVGLRFKINADGSVALSWTRRSRLGWNWIDGADVPLGEEAERYQLRIRTAAGSEQLFTCETAAFMLSAEARGTSEVIAEVRQAGDHGLSPPAIITIPHEE